MTTRNRLTQEINDTKHLPDVLTSLLIDYAFPFCWEYSCHNRLLDKGVYMKVRGDDEEWTFCSTQHAGEYMVTCSEFEPTCRPCDDGKGVCQKCDDGEGVCRMCEDGAGECLACDNGEGKCSTCDEVQNVMNKRQRLR